MAAVRLGTPLPKPRVPQVNMGTLPPLLTTDTTPLVPITDITPPALATRHTRTIARKVSNLRANRIVKRVTRSPLMKEGVPLKGVMPRLEKTISVTANVHVTTILPEILRRAMTAHNRLMGRKKITSRRILTAWNVPECPSMRLGTIRGVQKMVRRPAVYRPRTRCGEIGKIREATRRVSIPDQIQRSHRRGTTPTRIGIHHPINQIFPKLSPRNNLTTQPPPARIPDTRPSLSMTKTTTVPAIAEVPQQPPKAHLLGTRTRITAVLPPRTVTAVGRRLVQAVPIPGPRGINPGRRIVSPILELPAQETRPRKAIKEVKNLAAPVHPIGMDPRNIRAIPGAVAVQDAQRPGTLRRRVPVIPCLTEHHCRVQPAILAAQPPRMAIPRMMLSKRRKAKSVQMLAAPQASQPRSNLRLQKQHRAGKV